MNRKLVTVAVTAATVLGTTALASSAWAADSWSGTHKATRSVVAPAKADSWSVVTPAKADSWSVTRSVVQAGYSSNTPAGTKWISNTIVSPNSRTWAAVPAGVKFTVHSDSSAWA